MIFTSFLKSILLCILIVTGSSFILRIDSDAVSKGDECFRQMRYLDAIAWYTTDSTSTEAQWRIARANVCYGETAAAAIKESYFRKAETAARSSISIDKQNGNGHTWLAASLGNIAMYEGSKAKVLLVTEIRNELDQAIALNSKDDIAYSILGSVNREIGNISWVERQLAETFIGEIPPGGYPDSEKAFKQAITLAPSVMRHWFELGLLYQYWDKPELAREAFMKAKTCPVFLKSDEVKLVKIEQYLNNMK